MTHVLALSGGVGGAKLAFGLSKRVEAKDLSIVVNTGDDFAHLGLHISPDIDTVLYTLAELADPQRGWGRKDETWNFMAALSQLQGEDWFNLGDRDLAVHVVRSHLHAHGYTLSESTRHLAKVLGIAPAIIPMTDDAVRTMVHTDSGVMEFQDYFVRHKCAPRVSKIDFANSSAATPSPCLNELLLRTDLHCIVICPSNPYLSIDPILSLPTVRSRLRALRVPIIAVSPLLQGKAFKGPTAKLMREFGIELSSAAIARHYEGLITAILIDHQDKDCAAEISAMGIRPLPANITMSTPEDRIRLAEDVLAFADECHGLKV